MKYIFSHRGLETRLRFCSSTSRLVSGYLPLFLLVFSFPIRLLLPTAVDQGLEVVAAVAPLVQPGWIELDTKIFSPLHLFLPIHPSRNNLTHLMQPYHCALLFPLPTSTNFKTSNRPGSCSVFLRMHFHCSCRSSRGKT